MADRIDHHQMPKVEVEACSEDLSRSRIRVLQIEDNPFDAEILAVYLDQTCYAGSEIVKHETISAAKEILLREQFDLILLDLSLKDSDASQTLSCLNEFNAFAPVIVSSSYDDKKTIRKIINLGAEDCLPKIGLNSRDLERTIGYAIDRWNLKCNLYDANQRMTNIFCGTGIGTWEWNIQKDIFTFDNVFAKILGYQPGELVHLANEKWKHYIHPEDQAQSDELLARHISGKSDYYECEVRLRHKNGQWVWVLLRGKLVIRIKSTRSDWMIGTLMDITQRKQDEETLRIIQLVYQNTSEAIMVTDVNNCIIAINPAFTELTGYGEKEVMGKNPNILSSGKQDQKFYQDMWESIDTSGKWEGEIWNRKKNGEEYVEQLNIDTIYNSAGAVQYRVAQFSDITEKKFADSLIWAQAHYDPLTNLPNRRFFTERLDWAITDTTQNGRHMALFLIDLDHFKEINDAFGHYIGDELLIEAAKRIKNCLRKSDIVARLGGDEFTVILSQLESLSVVDHIAQCVIDTLALPFEVEQENFNISASIGITFCPDDGTTSTELLKNADQAMYEVKKNGRSGYGFFTSEMQEKASKRRKLTQLMRNALPNNELLVYFQPIVELQSGKIHKAEALLRWKTSEYSFVSPDLFIPIAEKTGAIHEMGEWILEQSIDEVIYCQEKIHPDFQISVNMSPVQFLDGSKSRNQWKDYIVSKRLQRGIVVEITEGLLLNGNLTVADKFRNFQDYGIEVAIDDFGTGYSSLSYLKKFNIHYVKIDRSFIHNIEQSNENQALCEAIVVMAHKLGLKVIAEGIETKKQQEMLLKMGCDYGQGYLFARPMPRKEFRAYLTVHEAVDSSSRISEKDVVNVTEYYAM